MTESAITTSPPGRARVRGYLQLPRNLQRFGRLESALVATVVAALGMRILEFFAVLSVVKPIVLLVGFSFFCMAWITEGRVFSLPFRFSSTKWILAFHVWVIACIPTSVWQGPSISIVKGMLPLFAGLWVILAVPVSNHAATRVQWIFVLGAAVFALLNVLMGGQQFDGRYGGSIGMDINDIALVLASVLPLAMGLAIRSAGVTRLALWGAVALMMMVIMRTGSRGGGLALVAGAIVLLLGMPWRRSLQLLLLGLPLMWVTWTAAPESFRTRMTSLFAGEEDYNQTDENGRIAIWKRGLDYGMKHPVLGVGPGAFVQQDGIGKAERGLQGKWSVAHNIYVQAFAELGFPGLFLFLASVGSVGRSAWAVFRGRHVPAALRRPEYLASIVAFLVGATFLSFLFYQMTWVLLAGLTIMAAGSRAALSSRSGLSEPTPLRARSVRRGGLRSPRPGYAASTRS